MIGRGLRYCRDWFKRLLKLARSLYYFGKCDLYVHGRIQVGDRRKIRVGKYCSINGGVIIQGFHDIRIGNGVVLSPNCMILDGNLDYDKLAATGKRAHVGAKVELEDNVWIGAGAIILPGVKIGAGSVVGAGAVVTRSFPADVVIAGNPAEIVRRLR